MFSPGKTLRLAFMTGALALGLAGTARATGPVAPVGPQDPTDLQAPDCFDSCTRTLGPGQRLVVAASRYAPHGVTVRGNADGFGARFVVKRSPDLGTFTKALESPITTHFGPVTIAGAGYYRAIAVNDGTWFDTTATVTISTY
jgi:hypothetical protein